MTDFQGNLLAYLKDLSHASEGPDVAMSHVINLIDRMMISNGVAPSDLNGIGISISGVLDRTMGTTMYWPKLPRWVNVPVKKILEDRFQTLVALEDTSRTSALAEVRFGSASTAKHFISISLGAGTGAALFLNESLFMRASGALLESSVTFPLQRPAHCVLAEIVAAWRQWSQPQCCFAKLVRACLTA